VACSCLPFSSWCSYWFWPFSSWVTPCPAPPRAAAVGLTFSSSDDPELQVTPCLLLGVIRMIWWNCGRTVCSCVCWFVLVVWELLAPSRANLLHQQLHWAAVVLTTPQPSHGDWAACKQLLCLLSRLDLILTTLSVTLEMPKCWVHTILYQIFKNRYLTWSL
jgi:hypothetical protein